MATGLREGTVLDGKYRIDRRLAEGGMGVVFVAEHLYLKKPVALKVLHAQLSEHPEAVERFTVEARAASLVDHENVVRISDFGKCDGQLYLVMELLEGRDLADELDRESRLSVTRARFVACQILRGLEAAHARGVIHRDLKPENVFVSPRPSGDLIKILDFGIARMRPDPGSNLRLTKDGAVMGTPFYMAPEQLKGQKDVDARTDLYAVGVILYEMLAGTPPYTASSFSEIAHVILEARPMAIGEVAPAVDPVLSAIVMKAFAPAREARFQTAGELLGALERHRIEEPLPAPKSPFTDARTSQLTDLPSPENPTVRDRNLPMTLAATLDRSLDRETPEPEPAPTPKPSTTPLLTLSDEPALALDRPPPSPVAVEPRSGRTIDPLAPPRGRAPWWIAVVLLLGAAGAGFLMMRPADAAPVTIGFYDLPRNAKVFLDGTATTQSFKLARDGRQHRVRLQAPGFTDKGLLFIADENQTLDGQMQRGR